MCTHRARQPAKNPNRQRNTQTELVEFGIGEYHGNWANTGIEMNANEILDREFLEIRSKLLDIAAALDRLERAEGSVESDPRMQLLTAAAKLNANDSDHNQPRAEKMQMLFSRQYDPEWIKSYDLSQRE